MTADSLYNFTDITNPTEFIINTGNTYDSTSFVVRNRTEKGWTLDFIFNMNGLYVTSGNTFYYWGIKDETDPAKYIDNNLSFSFTPDNKIQWKKTIYSNYCGEDSIEVTDGGSTSALCIGGTSDDFNITIVFDRNFEFDNCCDLGNDGGVNDLFTGWTDTFIASGATADFDVVSGFGGWGGDDSAQLAMNNYINDETEKVTILTLNENWYAERYKRLGTLKIYFNGRLVYKNTKWEEVIPIQRSSLNDIVQVLGGGTTGSGGIHLGTCQYEIKEVSYYEEPLSYIQIRNNYITHQSNYSINECKDECTGEDILPSPTPSATPP